MKIFVTGTRGIPDVMGGVETHCEELFPRLATKGFDITLARRTNYVHDNLHEWKGIHLVDISTPKRKSLEAITHTFKAIIRAKKEKADIVHIHAIGPALLVPFAKALGLKVVFTHHGPDYDRDKWGRMAKFILKLGERLGVKYADDVIVISDVIRNSIAKMYGRTKNVHLIYNGVPKPDICTYPRYFDELGISVGKYVLGMSRFVPEKNLHHLIEAFAKLGSTQYKLVIAGDSDFEDDYSLGLKKMAKANGVVLTGFVRGRKLHSLLSNAALYVLPSSHEGLPIALLEAMSYSLPVVVSDIPANLEVGLDKDDYFPCGDVSTLSRKIREKLTFTKNESYDMTKYNWDKITDEVTQVYTDLYKR